LVCLRTQPVELILLRSLRLYPGVSHLERVATEDDIIPLRFPVRTPSGDTITSIPIKAGQKICILAAAADRLKTVWGPDADIWRPERWLEEGGLPDSSHMNAGYARLFAFSQGARVCIGVRLAVYQIKVRACVVASTSRTNQHSSSSLSSISSVLSRSTTPAKKSYT